MALTPFRWVAGVIVAGLVAMVLILRVETRPTHVMAQGDALEMHWQGLQRRSYNTAGQLRLMQVVDSTRAVAARSPDKSAIRVFRDSGIPVAARAAFDSLAVRATAGVRSAGAIGIDIFFVYDTLSLLHSTSLYREGISTSYLLPRSASDRCTVITRVSESRRISGLIATLWIPTTEDDLLGPCAYYRAFGMPGRQIDAWLRIHGWSFAGRGSWTRAAPSLAAVRGYWVQGAPLIDLGASARRLGEQRQEFTTERTACGIGDAGACDTAIATPTFGDRITLMNGNLMVRPYADLGRARESYWYYGNRPFGRAQPYFLADVVREEGREKFSRFWTSDDAVPVAFEKATGESLGEWTSRWLLEQYGPLLHRPGVSASTAIVGVVLFGLGLFGAMFVSGRRQFV
jgi:hypothetical protein